MDIYTKLIDYVIRLIESRNQRKNKYYKEVVQVCYESAQVIRDDFIAIFKENEKLILEKRCLDEAAERLSYQRAIRLSHRDLVRANLLAVEDSELTEFEIGLKRLVSGHDEHALKNHLNELTELVRRMRKVENAEDLDRYINHALYLNSEAITIVDKAWAMINLGYAKYKKDFLST